MEVKKALLEQKETRLKGNIYHNTQIIFSYNTNRIEGSELTEEEVRLIFETNSTPDKTVNVDDVIEATNHFRMFDFMLETLDDMLTEELIKEFQQLLKRGTSDERREWFNIGEYKLLANEVGGTITTSPKKVPEEMKSLLKWYNSLKDITLEQIVEFHYKFEKIHPFQDGNGRVGRIIMFRECLKNNIMPFIIEDDNKYYYYRGLKEYTQEPGYLLETCLNSQDNYLKLVEIFLTE